MKKAPALTTAAIACVTLAVLTSSQNLLITWSKRAGGYEYNYVSVTMMTELLKLLLSLFFLLREQQARAAARAASSSTMMRAGGRSDDDADLEAADESSSSAAAIAPINVAYEFSYAGFVERLPYALPAIIYFLKNNLVFYGLRFLDPVQFQLLGNLKILTTTLLFRVIMKKPLSDLAYVSLLLLTVGLTFSQLKSEEQVSITPQALIIMGSIAMLSGLAGIVTEWLMKSNARRRSESLHVQNLWLYFYGIVFNLVAVLTDDYEAVFKDGFFHGYSFVTLLIIINNSCSGIAVSAIMKYANNLVKLFTFAVSLVLTTILSVYFFNFQMSLHFILGSVVVFVAIYLYQRKD